MVDYFDKWSAVDQHLEFTRNINDDQYRPLKV